MFSTGTIQGIALLLTGMGQHANLPTGLTSCGGGTGMTGRRGNEETTEGGGTPVR